MKAHLWAVSSYFLTATVALAQQPLNVTVDGITENAPIAASHAFCVADAKTHSRDGQNINPAVRWSKGPEGTRSYAILMHDTDVPTSFADANQEGKMISADLPRKDFYHWIRINIPADRFAVGEGEVSRKIDTNGKPQRNDVSGVEGANDFGTFMKGTFYGYDGPCPPWNDALLHRYHFTVYALDIPNLNLEGDFTGQDTLRAMEGHVLAKGSLIGTYTQNPHLTNVK